MGGPSGIKWSYQTRGTSLLRWAQALKQETFRSGFTWAKLFGFGFLLLLVVQGNEGGLELESNRSEHFFLAMIVMAVGALGPIARSHHLYPIPRRRRAAAVFAASAISWGTYLLGAMGVPLLIWALAGLASGQPLHARTAAEWAINLGMIVSALPVLSWARGAFLISNLWDRVNAFCIIAALVFIFGAYLIGDWGLKTDAAICVTLIAVSLTAYYLALRWFYTNADLIQNKSG